MKRVIALMVLAAALLTLCACGKSKAVKQTEESDSCHRNGVNSKRGGH